MPGPDIPVATGRAAILNGFGRSLGDSVIGLQALFAARALGWYREPPVLVRRAEMPLIVQHVYRAAADFCSVEQLQPGPSANTMPATKLSARFDAVIDIRDFAFDPGFRGVAMIDFFLARLGLDPRSVPPELRRNSWLAPRVHPNLPPPARTGFTLVCPTASMAHRTMPEPVHARILDSLCVQQGAVLTQGTVPDGLADRVEQIPNVKSFTDLCGLVASARRIVCTDTAIVHLADAFGVPCLAFFTTHLPAWRARDYPRCTQVFRPVAGLPMALEFSRGPDDLRACESAWFDSAGHLGWLDAVLDSWDQ